MPETGITRWESIRLGARAQAVAVRAAIDHVDMVLPVFGSAKEAGNPAIRRLEGE